MKIFPSVASSRPPIMRNIGVLHSGRAEQRDELTVLQLGIEVDDRRNSPGKGLVACSSTRWTSVIA